MKSGEVRAGGVAAGCTRRACVLQVRCNGCRAAGTWQPAGAAPLPGWTPPRPAVTRVMLHAAYKSHFL